MSQQSKVLKFRIKNLKFRKGFTLIELILVIGVFTIIFTSSTLVLADIIQRNSLQYSGYQLVQNIREVRTNALTQRNDSDWGIHFSYTSLPHGYTIFSGPNYAGRDITFDINFELPEIVRVDQLNLGSGGSDLIFSQSDARTVNFGNLSLMADGETYFIVINELGFVDYDF